MTFPNSLPRPDDELDTLERVWQPPSGWSFITVVNNTYIGLLYVGTAFLFFLLAGVLALMMRSQLAVPGNNLLSQDLYNQLFTMHGTIMMFLFAVPAVEALGVLLLPNMQAARDLPFPRLSAYAFWAYAARNFRPTGGRNIGNIWNAGTLEWLPNGNYSVRSIPIVVSREPIWDQPNLAEDVEAGRYYLPGAPTGGRETIITSPIDARPQYLVQMPGPSWPTVLAAFGTAAFFLLLTVKLVVPALISGVFAVAMVVWWLWGTDPGPSHPPVDIGGGIKLPVYVTGPISHSWWAMVVLILVSASIFASLVFAYFFLWTVSPEVWPVGEEKLPAFRYPLVAALLLAGSSAAIAYASRALKSARTQGHWPMRIALLIAIPLLIVALGIDLNSQWQMGLRPVESSYGAVVYTVIALEGFFIATVGAMGLYTLARSLCGLLNAERRATFDNTLLLWHYTVIQGLVGLAVVHLSPRLLG